MFHRRTIAIALGFGFIFAARAAEVWPGERWETATPAEAGLDSAKLAQARDYALTGGGSGMVVRGGKVVMTWGSVTQQYDLKSSTKSFGATALGLSIAEGKVRLDDKAAKLHPNFGVPPESNVQTGWLDQITLRHLATQTAGFEKPGGFTNLLFAPGTQWHYSDGGPNWLAECLTLAWRRDLNDVMFECVFTPLGIKSADLRWRENQYRPHTLDGIKRREFGAGIFANVDALARHGLLWLRGGRWGDRQILPADFVRDASRPSAEVAKLSVRDPKNYGNASAHYGYLWWDNGDGMLANVQRDAFWTWGLYDSITLVVPSLDLVVARAGQSWKRTPDAGHYDVLRPFFEPLVAAICEPVKKADAAPANSPAAKLSPPYPPSPVIKQLTWAPKDTIIRKARGSDNWPLTWADDDALYTAYGDGWGFEPLLKEKLSMGLARVFGAPPDFHGENLRAAIEAKGDDKNGHKASGILCVNSELYLLARNKGNSQLAWSADHAATWMWAGWKFTESFGCPTFLNVGRDYAGARDGFVYVFSHDADSAYTPADRFVLARVPRDKLRVREAYEFFTKLDSHGQPNWSRDIAQRGAVFTHAGNCYRSGVTYNAPLKRYLWCQILPKSKHPQGPRFQGGFGIYDAPEPWGPWTTVFFTEEWDVGPGETSSFPTKWMSGDGKTLWLVFSGNDFFSVRNATLTTASNPSLK